MDRSSKSLSLTSDVPTLFTHTHRGRQSGRDARRRIGERTGEEPKRRHAKCRSRRTSDHISSQHALSHPGPTEVARCGGQPTTVQAEVNSSSFLRKRRLCHFRRLLSSACVVSTQSPGQISSPSLITGARCRRTDYDLTATLINNKKQKPHARERDLGTARAFFHLHLRRRARTVRQRCSGLRRAHSRSANSNTISQEGDDALHTFHSVTSSPRNFLPGLRVRIAGLQSGSSWTVNGTQRNPLPPTA